MKMSICYGIGFVIVFSPMAYSKKYCDQYFAKLQSVQSQQRQGYSAKQAENLRRKEQKARTLWWACENGQLKKKKKTHQKKRKKK